MARRSFLATLAIPALVVVAVLAMSSLFIVDEREKALVLRLGRVVAVKEDPGLGLKVPFLDNVVRYDDRILGLPTTPLEVTPLDDRRLVVDAFARWRIVDVVQFRQAVGAGGVEIALGRLEPIVRNAIREVLGTVPSTNVLSDDRTALMNQIRDEARRNASGLGVEIIDVRLTRTDLPTQNLQATYARMRAEREREAADERARGGEAAQRVRAAADRTVVELTSEARKRAEVIRGEADATRNAIYADAFGRDPEFFAFSRSMTSYERALRGENSSLVMQPDSEFFEYLGTHGGDRVTLPATPPAATAPAAAETSATEGDDGEDLVTPTLTDREGNLLGESAGVKLTPIPESLAAPPEEPSAVVPPSETPVDDAATDAAPADGSADAAVDGATDAPAEAPADPAATDAQAVPEDPAVVVEETPEPAPETAPSN